MSQKTVTRWSISLPRELAKEVEAELNADHLTRSEAVRDMARRWLDKRRGFYVPTPSEREAIEDGLRAMKRGDFRPYKQVKHEMDRRAN